MQTHFNHLLKLLQLTMDSRVGSTDGRDGGSAGNDELVVLALVIRGLRLGKHHVVKIKPEFEM